MAYNSANAVRQNYLKVVKWQLIVGLIVFLLISVVFRNVQVSTSSGLGLLLAIVPSLVYIKLVWNSQYLPIIRVYAQHKKAILLKFITNIAGFMLVLVAYHEVQFLALLVTYVSSLTGTWFSLLASNNQSK